MDVYVYLRLPQLYFITQHFPAGTRYAYANIDYLQWSSTKDAQVRAITGQFFSLPLIMEY
jgi:hypothetical protein